MADRTWVVEERDRMRDAMGVEVCLASPDGWCYTHSTGGGPTYCAVSS